MLNYTGKNVNYIAIFVTLLLFILFAILNNFYHEYIEFNRKNLNYISNLKENYPNNSKQIYFNYISLADVENVKQLEDIAKEYAKIKRVEAKDEVEPKVTNTAKQESTVIKQEEKIDMYSTNKWRIKIPKIKLDAPISEGTTQEALRRTVGHFEGTTKWNGNVALAGHNRGYKCNFFQEIKKLKIGDEIIYLTEKGQRKYKVVLNKVIKQTNWDYVQPTKENKITLITCENNMSEYRRCIQAVEI